MYYPTLALVIMPELLDAIGYICKSSEVYDGVIKSLIEWISDRDSISS